MRLTDSSHKVPPNELQWIGELYHKLCHSMSEPFKAIRIIKYDETVGEYHIWGQGAKAPLDTWTITEAIRIANQFPAREREDPDYLTYKSSV